MNMTERASPLTRGEFSRMAGVYPETVRYYEKRGLLSTPKRSASGYRLYTEDHLVRVRFIRRSQELGFSLSEVSDLLEMQSSPDLDCAKMRLRTETHLAAIRGRIQDLQRIETALQRLLTSCPGEGPIGECSILGARQPPDAYSQLSADQTKVAQCTSQSDVLPSGAGTM